MTGMRVLFFVAVASLALTAVVPGGAGAAGQPSTQFECGFAVHLAFTPGIGPGVEAIRITSSAPGPLTCKGAWYGRSLTGQGTAVFEGDAVGSCGGSTFNAVVRMKHPVDGGTEMLLDLPFRGGRAGMELYGVATEPGRHASLEATGTPDAGQDCEQVPITGIAAEGRALFGPWVTIEP
jgi:hypothetical protein